MLRLCTVLLCWFLAAALTAAESIEWPMDDQSEVMCARNMEPGRVSNGKLVGGAAWDPHFNLKVPREGLNPQELTWLETRLYSSAPADLLDIYYKSADGRWCLGGKLKIARGWAIYRVDLTQNAWRETTTGPESRQWGGPGKQISVFRLDPGNEAGRTIMVDYVKLLPRPEGAIEGVTAEPAAQVTLQRLQVERRIQAGQPLAVSATFSLQAPPGLTQATAYVRLRHDTEIMVMSEQEVDLTVGPRVIISGELALSRYWNPGEYTVEAGAYEFEPTAGSPPSAVSVELVNPRVGVVKPPVVKLQRLGGDPAITVDGKPFPGLMMSFHGGDAFKLHREVSGTGLHLYCDWFGTSIAADLGHIAPDRYDYSAYDKYFATILAADPEALFLPHIGITAPVWWQAAHPEELCEYADGRKGPNSLASLRWRQEMGEDLRKLIAHLRQAPYADRLLGYTFYSGYTAEWQMWGTWAEQPDDYSAPATRAFREFLGRRYHTDAALQKAWGDPQATLAAAVVPTREQRWPKDNRLLRDPRTEQRVADWYEFASNMVAEAILHFARITRESTHGEALVGTYYAYLSAHGMRQADSGHCAAARVFDSPDLDYLMSPPNYLFRKASETSTFMSATDSLRLRGKLWIDEADNRTFLSDVTAGYGRSDNVADTLGVFWREHAQVLTKRAAVSYFDMDGGWYSHPDLLWNLDKAHKLSVQSLQGRQPFTPEVCLLVDPDSFCWLRAHGAVARLVAGNLTTAPQTGLPFDYCLLSDLGQSWCPDYKLYVFLNAVNVSARSREMIVAKLKRNKATALFLYAPGYLSDGVQSLDNIEKLTGIRLALDESGGSTELQFAASEPLAAGLDTTRPVGSSLPVAPRFYASDPGAKTLATLAGTSHPGLVLKRHDGWTALYSSSVEIPPALLRNLARQAGAHVYVDSGDATYADNRYVGVHAATEGEKTVRLPRPCRVRDALAGQELRVERQSVRFRLQKGETKLLELLP